MTTPTGDPPPRTADSSAPRVPRLGYDVARLGLACVAGVVTAVVTGVVVAVVHGGFHGSMLVPCLFAFSAASSVAYLVHTLRLFSRLDAPNLRRVLVATTPDSRFGMVGAMISGTGPTVVVQWSIIAIAAVLAFTVWPSLLREPLTVWLSVAVVAASWAVTVVAYAVHYARFDAAAGGFDFPGKDERIFSDFLYLAVQVQTTFSTSDVSLTLSGPRRLVSGHTLVSFAFNTIIIAMLITVLFVGGSS